MNKQFSWSKALILTLTHVGVAAIAVAIALLFFGRSNDPGMQKLEQLADYIDRYHVDNPDMQDVYDYAAAGMVAGTGDRWSYYVSAGEMAAYNDSKHNSYVGIGVTVQTREDESGIDILAVTPGGPAHGAGVLPGDVIIGVDGKDLPQISVTELSDQIRGEENTDVKIKVLRREETLKFTITRKRIEVKVAQGKLLDGNVGYIKIANFNEKCSDETIAAIEDLIRQGAEYLVFDVRGNPGGYKDEMVKILDYLLPSGILFKSVDYTGLEEADTSDDNCLEMPMAVLIDGESYSAAEFFAAALEEYNWAITGGAPTVGKGHMQVTLDLDDGSAVALSIAKYYTPKGVSLEDQGGLVPQISVEVDAQTAALIASDLVSPEEDPQLQAVIGVLTGKSQENP